MKHTDFLEMSSTSSNNSSEGRRGAPGSGVTFVPGGRPQRIMLRINGGGPLPAGQPIPIPVRLVHRAVPGQGATAWSSGVAFNSDPIVVQLQQQQRETIEQEEEQRKVRTKEAEKKKKNDERDEKLKKKLSFEQPPQIHQNGPSKREGVELRWNKLEVEAPREIGGELTYCVRAFQDSKTEGKEVFKGTDTSCKVPPELLILGHTHHFGVMASLGDIKGAFSPRSSIEIPAECPSKPLPPKVSNRGKNNLILRWNAPSDNGSQITSYDLEWDQCQDQWENLVSDKAKQYKFVHKFVPGSHALFRVRATNGIGTSEYSNSLSFSSGAGPPSVPKPPTMLEVGIKHLTLAWEPPESNGADITAYTLEMENPQSGYGYRPVYQGDQTSYTCSGLSRVTIYNFRLAAANEKGQSQLSPSVTFKTLPSIPGPPPVPRLKDRPQARSLSIMWQEPPDDGGSEIQTYILQMNDGAEPRGLASNLVDVYAGANIEFKAEELLPGKKYEARVCAVSSAGHGQWSPVASFTTPAVAPSAPLNLNVVGRPTQYGLTLHWRCPLSDGGSPITCHAIEVKGGEDEWNVVAIVADPRSFLVPNSTSDASGGSTEESRSSAPAPLILTHTIANLMPGTQYTFRVRCRNSLGLGAASGECIATTSPGQPDSPEGLDILDITSNSAILKWTDSCCHGCAVESYEVQFMEGGLSAGSHVTSITCVAPLQKLSPATSYQARVKAHSGVGDSGWSSPLTFTTGNASPSSPSHLDLVSKGPSSLVISWGTPSSNGCPISGYHVEVGPEAGPASSHIEVALETQCTLRDLRPSTTYKFRVQAENMIGRGTFSGYKCGTTLPSPPSPPHLSLASCSTTMLKVVWGKKTNRNMTFVLQLASPGNQFHEVYQGSAVNYRISRLQPNTDYTLRIAAVSDSGQGVWSDGVTFSTTPTHPDAVAGVSLTQAENRTLRLEWIEGTYSEPLMYEAQYRPLNSNQEFQQCYKGPHTYTNIFVSPPSSPAHGNSAPSAVYEARIRSCSTCSVNGRKEQLWSPYSNTAVCRWEEVVPKKESKEEKDEVKEKAETKASSVFSGRTLSVLVLVLITILTVVLAVVLGQVINV